MVVGVSQQPVVFEEKIIFFFIINYCYKHSHHFPVYYYSLKSKFRCMPRFMQLHEGINFGQVMQEPRRHVTHVPTCHALPLPFPLPPSHLQHPDDKHRRLPLTTNETIAPVSRSRLARPPRPPPPRPAPPHPALTPPPRSLFNRVSDAVLRSNAAPPSRNVGLWSQRD